MSAGTLQAAAAAANGTGEFSFALTRQLLEHPPFNATYGSGPSPDKSSGPSIGGGSGRIPGGLGLNRCTYYGRARVGGGRTTHGSVRIPRAPPTLAARCTAAPLRRSPTAPQPHSGPRLPSRVSTAGFVRRC